MTDSYLNRIARAVPGFDMVRLRRSSDSWQDFSRRSTATELMDTDPSSFEEFEDYLRDLERNNI